MHPIQFNEGFRSAVLLAAARCAFGGVLAALTIRNPTPRGAQPVTLRHPVTVRSTRLLLPLGSASESPAGWRPLFTQWDRRTTGRRNRDRRSPSRSVWLAVAP